MKWTYSVKNKLVASGALLLLCLLVLFSNYLDRNHTKNVKLSISTLYEDRLVAEVYILKMTSGVYQIKEAISADTNNSNKFSTINNIHLNIREENNAYLKTKLTAVEKTKSDELLNVFQDFESHDLNSTQTKLESANKALAILFELSEIQLEESKQILEHAEKLYLSGKTSSQYVFGLIIIILVVLQALVFSSKTLKITSKNTSSHFN